MTFKVDSSRRQAYLTAMGIQAWVSRDRRPEVVQRAEMPVEPVSVAHSTDVPPTPARAGGFPSEMLRAALRGEADVAPLPDAPAPVVARSIAPAPQVLALHEFDWPGLADQAARCKACELHSSRTHTVFGAGDQRARLMIVGEAPSADEDRRAEPFVGRAGELLNAMLMAMGLQREQVYLTNIVKCRPSGNRDPVVDETTACRAYLDRQIALVQPELVLCLGAVAAQHLLATDLPVGKLRGRPHALSSGTSVAVTYHPSYLLRKAEEKVKVWQDLQRVARILQGGIA